MKKFCTLTAIFVLSALFLLTASACSKSVNYLDYVSERRLNVYVYRDDDTEVKIYCSQKEQPYCADGIKGELCDLIEIFVKLPKNPQELEVSVEGFTGEMNYQAVDGIFYLSYTSPAFTGSGVTVTLTADGESKSYDALSVKDDKVMSCDDAVLCVAEHAKDLFESLTDGRLFDGEIYVRLLYDEGCYYFVGVCDKEKSIHAYLIDGERGKVIATKSIQG
ncbi:MAG: hypothetical protein HDQ88_06780 [Clostridia bacterium]|nr:hypothetical protein [Clostridia bacterium]